MPIRRVAPLLAAFLLVSLTALWTNPAACGDFGIGDPFKGARKKRDDAKKKFNETLDAGKKEVGKATATVKKEVGNGTKATKKVLGKATEDGKKLGTTVKSETLNGVNSIKKNVRKSDVKLPSSPKQLGGDLAREGKRAVGDITTKTKRLGGEFARGGKHLGNDIVRETKNAGGDFSREGKNFGNAIAKETKHLGDDAARETKRIGGDISRETKNMGGDIARESKRFGGDVARETKRLGGDIARETKDAGNDLSHNLKEARDDASMSIQKSGGKASDWWKDNVNEPVGKPWNRGVRDPWVRWLNRGASTGQDRLDRADDRYDTGVNDASSRIGDGNTGDQFEYRNVPGGTVQKSAYGDSVIQVEAPNGGEVGYDIPQYMEGKKVKITMLVRVDNGQATIGLGDNEGKQISSSEEHILKQEVSPKGDELKLGFREVTFVTEIPIRDRAGDGTDKATDYRCLLQMDPGSKVHVAGVRIEKAD